MSATSSPRTKKTKENKRIRENTEPPQGISPRDLWRIFPLPPRPLNG
jgi:hypothetical protein